MDVVGHEAIRPDIDAIAAARLRHQRHVEQVVLTAEKGGLPAVSSLRDVMWKPGDDCAGETCHVGGVPERSDTASWHGLRIVSPNLPRLRLKQSDLSPVMIGAWDWWFGRR